jgi:predicted RNase H-like HicB family nuclease
MRVFPKKADDGTTYWTATFPSVPGCMGGGDTPEEAVKEAMENFTVYTEFLKESKS